MFFFSLYHLFVRPPKTIRRFILIGLPALAVACSGLMVVSLRLDVHCPVRTNFVISASRGRLRVYWWDTFLWSVKYKSGVSLDDREHFAFEPWVQVQLGGESTTSGAGRYIIAVPLWMIAGASLLAWGGFRRAGWHRESWECRGCGYDVRGVRETRCPECGGATRAGSP